MSRKTSPSARGRSTSASSSLWGRTPTCKPDQQPGSGLQRPAPRSHTRIYWVCSAVCLIAAALCVWAAPAQGLPIGFGEVR